LKSDSFPEIRDWEGLGKERGTAHSAGRFTLDWRDVIHRTPLSAHVLPRDLIKPSGKPQPLDLPLRVGKRVPDLAKFAILAIRIACSSRRSHSCRASTDPRAQINAFVANKNAPGTGNELGHIMLVLAAKRAEENLCSGGLSLTNFVFAHALTLHSRFAQLVSRPNHARSGAS
jgi:hypothetical protein